MVDLKIELPEGFLAPEMRCGYEVSARMKKLWAVELDLFAEFVRVCEKHRWKYFALGGTLLGAVRHSGFIPWDDDIDLIMPRGDYDQLIEVGESEFLHPYFFQCPRTEHGFWRSHVQIRNSLTTGYIDDDAERPCNKGIFIDIFVLDEVPRGAILRRAYKKKAEMMSRLAMIGMNAELPDWQPLAPSKAIKKKLSDAIIKGEKYGDWFDKYNAYLGRYRGTGSNLVGHTSFGFCEASVWDKAWYEDTVQLDFEMMSICCPKQWHEVLSRYFGPDYMVIPPDLPNSMHGAVHFDAETPYTKYL